MRRLTGSTPSAFGAQARRRRESRSFLIVEATGEPERTRGVDSAPPEIWVHPRRAEVVGGFQDQRLDLQRPVLANAGDEERGQPGDVRRGEARSARFPQAATVGTTV